MKKNSLTLIVLCTTLVWTANAAAGRVVVPAKGGLPACQDVVSALPLCGNGVMDSGEQCDQSNLNDQTCAALGFFGGKLQCGASCQFDTSGCTSTRFVDNGDGTVTDNQTGLMWEQTAGMAGGTNTGVLNDVNNTYAWATAWTSLNGVSDGYTITGCFANYCDWRLPSVTEFRGILNLSQEGCGTDTGSCIDPIFGPTQPGYAKYWTATAVEWNPDNAWTVMGYGSFFNLNKAGNSLYVRAVRRGSCR